MHQGVTRCLSNPMAHGLNGWHPTWNTEAKAHAFPSYFAGSGVIRLIQQSAFLLAQRATHE